MRWIFTLIMDVKDEEFRDFLLVAFSNIQKDCSWWSMKSVKPCRDFGKDVPNAIQTFVKQVKRMIEKNNQLWENLKNSTWVEVFKGDTRSLSSIVDDFVDLILFSHPYVTSYEYFDVHKLSIIWLEHVEDLRTIKRRFIGNMSDKSKGIKIKSSLAVEIVKELAEKDRRLSKAVEAYFEDMQISFEEMDKVLKDNGVVVMVIGNTKLKGVEIKNAEVFAEMFTCMGYVVEKVIKRPIPSKNLPTVRDPKTGKFTSSNSHVKVYPHEFILILRHSCHLPVHKRSC